MAKKKPVKSVAIVFGPGKISPAVKKAMIAFQKKQHAKQLPKIRAAAQAKKKQEETLKRLKGITVKDLHKAIMLGLSYEEASCIAFDALSHLEIVQNSGSFDDLVDREWVENFLRYLVKKNDHSIHFVAEEDQCQGFINWGVDLKPYDPEAHLNLFYSVTELDHPDSDAEEDAITLNQFILDFYGIKKHAEIKKTKKEIRAEIKTIRDEIKDLTAKMNKLSKSLEETQSPRKAH
jgi:hypothetical protein